MLTSTRQALTSVTEFSWPKRFPIVQFPNAPLIVGLVAGEVGAHTRADGHVFALSVSYVAMSIWAYLELTQGVNWFRRMLGVGYLAFAAVRVALALQT